MSSWAAIVSFDGGLGNRLFQAAFALGCARRSSAGCASFGFHKEHERTHHSDRTYSAELFDRFREGAPGCVDAAACHGVRSDEDADMYYTEDPRAPVVRYNHRAQDPPDVSNDVVRVLYRGRFGYAAYFDPHCRDELLALLRPEPEVARVALDAMPIPWASTMFLHVRLGDYVGDATYWDPVRVAAFYEDCLGDAAYAAASAYAATTTTCVAVLSDGTRADVISHFPRLHARIAELGMVAIDVDARDELVALYLMARCELGGIVPNSTFSWWGAYLVARSPRRRVYHLGTCGDRGDNRHRFPDGDMVWDMARP